MFGVRTMNDPKWKAMEIQARLDAKREQEARFPDGRLLDFGPDFLLVDAEGWFAPQRVERVV